MTGECLYSCPLRLESTARGLSGAGTCLFGECARAFRVLMLPSTHRQFRPNQVESCRAQLPWEVLAVYRQQSQRFAFQPPASEAAPVLQRTFRVQKKSHLQTKSIRSIMFFKRQNAHTSKPQIPTSFLGD